MRRRPEERTNLENAQDCYRESRRYRILARLYLQEHLQEWADNNKEALGVLVLFLGLIAAALVSNA